MEAFNAKCCQDDSIIRETEDHSTASKSACRYLTCNRRIASILSAYDDLIENNRRRIQLLEQAARLLYKEWFVHLRFPGHEHVKIRDGVPEGWEAASIVADIVQNSYGEDAQQKE